MAELNFKQIKDKLNAEFDTDIRRLVFWYDGDAEFAADIDQIVLENAKVLKLEPDNQFYTKYFLEREDTTTNYLVYAPFQKPALKENHLADTIRYSKEFSADMASLIAVDLGFSEDSIPVLKRYKKFFNSKERTQKFYDIEFVNESETSIITALMCVICKAKIISFEEVVRLVIAEGGLENNRFISEFEKFDLIEPFWKMCSETFGYGDPSPSLHKLIYTLFATYTSKVIKAELPKAWHNYCSNKSGSVIAFLDSIMNSLIYKDEFDALSDLVYSTLNGDDVLSKLDVDDYFQLELFRKVDIYILKWMIERLKSEDTAAELNGRSIPELCKMRRKMHFGPEHYSHYYIIENAYHIIKAAGFEPKKTPSDIWKDYIAKDYLIDQRYRYFYYHYDLLADSSAFEKLRDLVESIYTNRYLNPLSVAWSEAFAESRGHVGLTKQREFYNKYLKNGKERTVVIISDGFRYEVGQTLVKRLAEDEKCTVSLDVMQGILPSYTRLGMAALLPHKELTINEDFDVLVDGKACLDTKSREAILRQAAPQSRAVQFKDLKNMKVAELKEIFAGQDIVYIYHDQIDDRGTSTDGHEVFAACEEAVLEIHAMIKRLTSANNIHFIITADHGFLCKKDKLTESDKISGIDKNNSFTNRRYVISDRPVESDGVGTITLGDSLDNKDKRIISFPVGSDVFKVPASSQNYVHGGPSLQEIIIPVIDVRTTKYHMETKSVSISMVSSIRKITNLTTNLDFIQKEAVSDVNKETTYKLFFISDDNEKISNDNIYVADRKDEDASKRVFRLKFTFKNRKYDKDQKYYLVCYDHKNDLEVLRHEVEIDLAFTDDFGFNV